MGIVSGRGGTASVAFGTAGLLVLIFVFLVGPVPIAERLYDAGWWPRDSPSELATSLNERSPFTGVGQYRCEDGTLDWDYLCFAVRANAGFKLVVPPGPAKYGVSSGPFASMPTLIELPLDGPTPPLEAVLRWLSDGTYGKRISR